MKIFEKLNSIRAFQRTNMPYLESLEDYDIVCEIGAAQEGGMVFIPKRLIEDNLGAPATIRRRLDRLVKLGIVTKGQGKDDHRTAPLQLTRDAIKAYAKLEKLIERLDKE